ncbi:nucleotidyltransferase family protein [Halomarina ordinaria]|uniref:Nucleotidyltransferase family protein n=1 Tax=Halomarina ordinaria TaxID=3033939 RepID=A0ABD5U8K6_9EURY|nr:nucleotidyltransferase family protein [Halomarina sp. PSRA2]
MSDDGPRVVTAEEVGAIEEKPRPSVVGVVLAAGTSSRFGAANKLLADLDGDALVRHAARTLLDAHLDRIVVVLGHEAVAVGEALADLAVTFVENPDYAAGQSTSVGVGVRAAVEADADAAVFLPGDMPFVGSETVDLLVDAHRAGVGSALAAAHDGRRGNPVLFDRRHFDALTRVDGDVGGRRVLLGSDDAALLAVDDPGVRRDVDTPEDLSGGRGDHHRDRDS